MKYIYTLIALAMVSIGGLFGQKNVHFEINHYLDAAPFAFNQTTSNNLGDNFQVDRLEYYISEVTLYHDGGQVTPVANTWLLINASTPTSVALGSFNITVLDSVGFAVGVDSSVNHDDPSLWPSGHPLAPRSPSMHWGWVGGYRFVAMEGLTGANMNDGFEIHALGDKNYLPQTIVTAGVDQGSDLYIRLDADYTQAVRNITVSPGLISHGSSNEAATLLENFQGFVFTPTATATALPQANSPQMTVFPNPVVQGKLQVRLEGTAKPASLQVSDLTGKVILSAEMNRETQLDLNGIAPGCYFLSARVADEAPVVKKIVLQ